MRCCQVTDMMVANSANMIITVKPANQNNNVQRRGVAATKSGPPQMSRGSPITSHTPLVQAAATAEETSEPLMENDDEDEVREYVKESPPGVVDVTESGNFPRAAWGSQNMQKESVAAAAGKTSATATPASDTAEASKTEVAERLNGVSLQNDAAPSSHDQNKHTPLPTTAKIASPHETTTKAATTEAEEIRADELNVAKNVSRSASSNPESKYTSNVRVVFTPIEDL